MAVAARDDRPEATCIQRLERGHAERILPLLEKLRSAVGWAWRDIDLIAVTLGPGSFTGLRAGIAVARGLALALDRPALGIGALEVAAEAVHAAVGTERLPIVIVMDARRDEYAVQHFAPDLSPLTIPVLVAMAELARVVPTPCIAGGDAAAVLRRRVGADVRVVAASPAAAHLVAAVRRRLGRGERPVSGCSLRPFYLRPPDARPAAGAPLVSVRH